SARVDAQIRVALADVFAEAAGSVHVLRSLPVAGAHARDAVAEQSLGIAPLELQRGGERAERVSRIVFAQLQNTAADWLLNVARISQHGGFRIVAHLIQVFVLLEIEAAAPGASFGQGAVAADRRGVI